ncbi:MAG: MerR family transcriptional regulator [Candidatus Dojkabacteria bacterium]|jgi:DNA-binding transcriptional MerR regulator
MKDNKQFKTNDAKKATGLTERQLKSWYLNEPSPNRQEGEWRKYTASDVIILKILAELRKNGIELNTLTKLKRWLQTEDAIEFLLKKINIGFSMFLCTNFVDYFGFEDDSEGYDFVFLINNHVDEKGKVEIDKPITVLPLNGIVEDVLRRLNIGKDFNTKPNKQLSLPMLTQLMPKDTDLTIQEKKVLELLKEKNYQNLNVKVKDGKIVHINREESITLDN